MLELNLNSTPWTLQGWWPGVPLWMETLSGIMGAPFLGVTEPIPATVPGGVHYDLWKAGVIDDPYRNRNSLLCEWVENRWWKYSTTFSVPSDCQGKALSLIFRGIDYHAHFYLNGSKLGEHIGQFDEARFAVTSLVACGSENRLDVVFEDVPDESGQIGFTSRTWTQKSRFAYKWDWSTRLVNIGIWDDVVLRATEGAEFGDVYIATSVAGDVGRVLVRTEVFALEGVSCRVVLQLSLANALVAEVDRNLRPTSGLAVFEETLTVPEPQLWYPNGSGEQPLYTVKLLLYRNGQLSDEQCHRVGIRSLRFERNVGSDPTSLPYTIVVNETPIYAKSVNLSPWDQMYGNVTRGIYERNVLLLKRANINLVRINGCGLIEKKAFYELCDEHGIMIWQDLIQSSSGIDNVPSVLPEFLSLLKRTAISVVKRRRNHVSTTIWCGGNELMDEESLTTGKWKPVTMAHPNIAMLKQIVGEHDPEKLFLPSSASGPNFGLDTNTPGKNHDVHGPHTYLGVVEHYRTYNDNDCLFHGELGTNGMAGMVSLRKFLDEPDLCVTTARESLNWRHHGEWWDSRRRDEGIFGPIADLGRLVKASQFIQAEGLRYALEANRRRKFRNSGSSIWAFNEAFPNVSNCAFVDYYGIPKMAYYWVAAAFAPLHCSLRYDKLFFPVPEQFRAEVFIHNSLEERSVEVAWEILEAGGGVLAGDRLSLTASPNSARRVCGLEENLPNVRGEVFFVRLRLLAEGGQRLCQNLYVFSRRETHVFAPLFDLTGGDLSVRSTGSTSDIANRGSDVCLFVHGAETSGDATVHIENNYTSLFPGEEERFVMSPIHVGPNARGHELTYSWDYFNSPALNR